jgi:hypothetical protein
LTLFYISVLCCLFVDVIIGITLSDVYLVATIGWSREEERRIKKTDQGEEEQRQESFRRWKTYRQAQGKEGSQSIKTVSPLLLCWVVYCFGFFTATERVK